MAFFPANYQDISTGNGQVVLAFSFQPNSSSAVVNANNRGKGVSSVTWNSTGNFTVALLGSYLSLIQGQVSIFGSTTLACKGVIYSEQVSNSTSPSLVVQVTDLSGTALDLANTMRIGLLLTLSTSSLNQ